MPDTRRILDIFYTFAGWLCLFAFVELGYMPAIFCKNMILLGYVAPSNHADTLSQLSMLVLAILSYASYMAFARLVMAPIAIKKLPRKALMSRDAAHELDNQRFFFSLMPSFLLIAGFAFWDLLVYTPIPGSQEIYQATETLMGWLMEGLG